MHFWTTWALTPSLLQPHSFMTLSSIFFILHSPRLSVLSFFPPLSLFLCVCVVGDVVIRRSRRNRVKSPWSWNAPTSTFKLDSISTAGSDKRVCVQLSQVTGLWGWGGCFESGWGWELNEKSQLTCSFCCDCRTLRRCFSKPGWVETHSWVCGEIKTDIWIILDVSNIWNLHHNACCVELTCGYLNMVRLPLCYHISNRKWFWLWGHDVEYFLDTSLWCSVSDVHMFYSWDWFVIFLL